MRYRFSVLSGGRAGQTFECQDPVALIGRGDGCNVQLDPFQDVVVSQRHGRVTLQGSQLLFEDTSTNGSFVNGQPIKQVVLQHGMVVQLGSGGPQLRFELMEGPAGGAVTRQPTAGPQAAVGVRQGPPPGFQAAPSQAYQAPPVQAHPTPPAQAYQAPPAPPPAPAPAIPSGTGGPRIIVEHITHFNQARQEFESQVVRLGRDPNSEIAFDPDRDLMVSANHCKIIFSEGKFVLLDNESTNGTFVNDARVKRRDLQGGEVLTIGTGGPRMRVSVVIPTVKAKAVEAAPMMSGKTILGDASMLEDIKAGKGDAKLLLEHRLEQGKPVTIGRGDRCEIKLPSMHCSEHHARIEPVGGGWGIRDLGSSNGTYVNGQRIMAPVALPPGSDVMIPPYLMRFTGFSFQVFDTRSRTWVDAYHVNQMVGPRKDICILDDINFRIDPGSFVAMLGPSGAGKSTLLKALNGAARATSGNILVNNVDFYRHFEALKSQVGYVPQDDIIHPQLSLRRSLHYAAMLRMPTSVSRAQRKARIDEVMSILELTDRANTRVSMLSGGQRKRVSIGVELLTEPSLIYLDEPTSGLSPDLEEKMMHTMRELALRGRTVVCVTHMLDNVDLCDRIAILMRGKLVFYGTEPELKEYFEVKQSTDTYKKLEEHTADEWKQRYKQTPLYRKHIIDLLPFGEGQPPAAEHAPPPKRKRTGPGPISQFFILTTRYAELIVRDARNTGILLAQAPLIALFTILAVTGERTEEHPTSTAFLVLGLAALWCGCSNSAREITKEEAIFKRERMVGQSVLAYVSSKFFVLSLLSFVQVAIMLVMVHLFALKSGAAYDDDMIIGGAPGNLLYHLLNLQLTSMAGVGIGLFISSIVNNSDKAMSIVPIVLIPQVLFSGAFGLSSSGTVQRFLGYVMPLNWSLDLFKRTAACDTGELERLYNGATPADVGCLYGFHAGHEDADPLFRVVAGQMPELHPAEFMLMVRDGLYGFYNDLSVLSGLVIGLFIAVTIAVRITKK